MRRTIYALLTAIAITAFPAASQAATPFTAGIGEDPSVAVDGAGTGHVVWVTTESNVKVGYCRIPAGGTSCNRTELLAFPGTDANSAGRATVHVAAPSKVVIVAGCWNCPTGIADRTYRWVSTDNGGIFAAPIEIDAVLGTNGFGTWIDGPGIFVSAAGSRVKAEPGGAGEGVQYATGGIFVYGPQVVQVPGSTELVAATNDLDVVKYGVYVGGSLVALTINGAIGWQIDKTLTGAEGDNSDTSLTSGPNGVTLAYEESQSAQSRVGVRRYDPVSNEFGGPVYVQGADPIDQNGLQEPDSFQDPSGRIHVVWTSLFDGGRLRYVVSDTAGNNFGVPATLAKSEIPNEAEVAAGSDGRGFAAWTSGISGPIRVVPLDPQAESGTTGPGPDTTPPATSGLGIDDARLTPGQSAKFTFNSSEAGLAVLTFEKRFLGIKGKKKGKKACLPRTKKRLAALRKRAGSAVELKKLLKKKKCTGYRKIGEIRQKVVPGRNTIEFDGRIAGRPLAPGHYRALLVVTDAAGLVSRTESVSFKVIGKKRKKPKR